MDDGSKARATPMHELPMGMGSRPKIMAVETDDTYDEVGMGLCTAITFGCMKGSMDFVPTIQVWHGEELASEICALHAVRVVYKINKP